MAATTIPAPTVVIDLRSDEPVEGLTIRLLLGRSTDAEMARRYHDAVLTAEVTERLRAL